MLKIDLKDKVIIVSGAAGGIGSEISKQIVENGGIVVMNDVNPDGAKLAEELNEMGPGKATFICGNVNDEAMCKSVCDKAASYNGHVYGLINNCGQNVSMDLRGKIWQYKKEAWDRTISTCLDGGYFLTKYAYPYMKENGGRIIMVGSVTGFRMGLRNQAAYNSAKAGIHNLTRNMAIEFAPDNITVNCYIPGTTWHKRFRERLLDSVENGTEKFLSHVPAKRENVPEDMAATAMFFLSDEAHNITGLLANVDNGWAAGYCRTLQK